MIEQIINIWKYFEDCHVKYLVIGGFAVNLYGYTRNTGDLDILIEDTQVNRINLRNAFRELGIGDFESIETMEFIPGWTDFTLDFGLRLDIMTSIMGLENFTFQQLYDEATIVELGGVQVRFIDYENLIKAKKALNRLKDQLDIEELGKINDE
ncbi:MAG: nucleotidyltransferase [Flavobacterium sp.]